MSSTGMTSNGAREPDHQMFRLSALDSLVAAIGIPAQGVERAPNEDDDDEDSDELTRLEAKYAAALNKLEDQEEGVDVLKTSLMEIEGERDGLEQEAQQLSLKNDDLQKQLACANNMHELTLKLYEATLKRLSEVKGHLGTITDTVQDLQAKKTTTSDNEAAQQDLKSMDDSLRHLSTAVNEGSKGLADLSDLLNLACLRLGPVLSADELREKEARQQQFLVRLRSMHQGPQSETPRSDPKPAESASTTKSGQKEDEANATNDKGKQRVTLTQIESLDQVVSKLEGRVTLLEREVQNLKEENKELRQLVDGSRVGTQR